MLQSFFGVLAGSARVEAGLAFAIQISVAVMDFSVPEVGNLE